MSYLKSPLSKRKCLPSGQVLGRPGACITHSPPCGCAKDSGGFLCLKRVFTPSRRHPAPSRRRVGSGYMTKQRKFSLTVSIYFVLRPLWDRTARAQQGLNQSVYQNVVGQRIRGRPGFFL
ncbi:hypothetical protein DL98DRAFT_532881 [Cadophora sp. DSE1049]|nr:hypothetical protein DL98DRAFT_532881 [Cadophora sp. DSE1049]